MDRYYAARQAILSGDGTCESRLAEAMPRVEDAAAAARDCGCAALTQRIDDLIADASTGAACAARADGVIEAGHALERLVEACH